MRWVRRLVPATFICLLLLFLPLPRVDFVASAFGISVALPAMAEAGAAELAAMDAASDEPLIEDRVIGRSTEVDEFEMIGVSLDEQPSEPVLVRVDEGDGWSEWMELEVGPDEGPDQGSSEALGASGKVATEPIWVGSADGFEVSLTAGDAVAAEVALVRNDVERVVVDATPLAEAAPSPFPINPRSSWNTRSTNTSTTGSLKLAVVHHTATSNEYSAAQVPGIIRSMQAYHMDTLGWSDIGYNFIVDKFGRTWEGRGGGMDRAVIGAHAAGFNTGSVGVSIIGNYVGVASTPAALEATSKLIGWRLGAYGVDPAGLADITSGGSSTIPKGRVVNLPRVIGHRDVGATSCPGSIYDSLGSVRNRAQAWYLAFESLRNPVGSLDRATVDGRRLTVSGWSKDPDTAAAVRIHIYAGPRAVSTPTGLSRPDVNRVHPGFGDDRGYAATFDGMPVGTHRVCAIAINQDRGTGNTTLGCTDVVVK